MKRDAAMEKSAEQPNIASRTFRFSVRIIRLARLLGTNPADQVLARQIARSGTSIGVNIAEAQDAHSRSDFIRRMNIARTEARETLYWLRLLSEADVLPARRLAPLIREADEVLRILVTIVKTSRERS